MATSRAAGSFSTADLFDTEVWPLDRPDSAAWHAAVDRARAGLAADNCAVLGRFLRQEALAAMQDEGRAVAPLATYTENLLNPYFSETPDDCPADHPLRRCAASRCAATAWCGAIVSRPMA